MIIIVYCNGVVASGRGSRQPSFVKLSKVYFIMFRLWKLDACLLHQYDTSNTLNCLLLIFLITFYVACEMK